MKKLYHSIEEFESESAMSRQMVDELYRRIADGAEKFNSYMNEEEFTKYVCSKLGLEFVKTRRSYYIRRHPTKEEWEKELKEKRLLPKIKLLHRIPSLDLYHNGTMWEIKYNVDFVSIERAIGQCIFVKYIYEMPVGIILPKEFDETMYKEEDLNEYLTISIFPVVRLLKKVCEENKIKLWFI